MTDNAGVKYNAGKPSGLHLIPWAVLTRLIPAHMRSFAGTLHSWARREVGEDRLFALLRQSEAEGPVVLGALAPLQYGQEKYAAYNWEKGLRFTDVSDAGLRHALGLPYDSDAYRPTEEDRESGINHEEHLICNIMFAAVLGSTPALAEFDNRPSVDDAVTPPVGSWFKVDLRKERLTPIDPNGTP